MPKISKEDIYNATDGGKTIIEAYYSNSRIGFESNGHRKFRIRSKEEDPTPSASVKQIGGVWRIKDFGGNDRGHDAISLVMEKENLSFVEALEFIAANYCAHLVPDNSFKAKPMQANITRFAEALEDKVINYREDRKFTTKELGYLGFEIEEKHAHGVSLYPVDSYISAKNSKGESWEFSSHESFPMFGYDYDTWGKIYQPLSTDYRFTYYGEKPSFFLFGDNETREIYQKALKGAIPDTDENTNKSLKKDALIICSGGSDALNVYAAGYNVAWLNSETEEFPRKAYTALIKWFHNIYVLYDNDTTGYEFASKMCLEFIEMKLIQLPEDLATFKTPKGKPCKDAKDYFMYYRPRRLKMKIRKAFEQLVKTSEPLRFWDEKTDKEGNFTGYDINNQRLYKFLGACGFCKLDIPSGKRNFSYAHIEQNVVKIIAEEDLQVYVNNFLVDWILDNPYHYNIHLINSIHRSNQVKLASLERLRYRQLDLNSFGRNHDYIFFQNTALKISPKGLEEVNLSKVNKFVLEQRIISHHFRTTPPLFEVQHSKTYAEALDRLQKAMDNPRTPKEDVAELKKELDGIRDLDKYQLTLNHKDFSFLQYMYNTGRVYWKKEEAGRELTADEQKEHDLHFISKVAALGYQMFRFKEKGQAFMVYSMETEVSETGTHLGGTGKSINMESIKYIRHQCFRDGQGTGMQDDDKVFSGVQKGITEHLFIDDLSDKIDLHRFMPKVTADMEVKQLYKDPITIPFEESPKVGFTSNHGIKKFDSSLRRRTWFNAFCNYYHPEDLRNGITERSPLNEFGKNLITEYSTEEMNLFYNFMAQCIHTYIKFRTRIQPPMEAIERRTIQREIGDEFIFWCEDFFFDGKNLNDYVNKHDAFEDYKKTMPEKYRDNMKAQTFKKRLILYCQYASTSSKHYIFNPTDLLTTPAEKSRNDIRRSENGKDVYYFYIQVDEPHGTSAPAPSSLKNKLEKPDEGTGANRQINIPIEDADDPFA